jgi:hypothetical protein
VQAEREQAGEAGAGSQAGQSQLNIKTLPYCHCFDTKQMDIHSLYIQCNIRLSKL